MGSTGEDLINEDESIQQSLLTPEVDGMSDKSDVPEFIRKIEDLGRRSTSEKNAGKRAVKTVTELPMQMPIWPENRRGMPNTFLRSALFSVRRHNVDREQYNDVKIATQNDFELFFTGIELGQDDEDLYMEIIHRTRGSRLGDTVALTGYELLKALGWGYSSKDYLRLQNSIHRLKVATIKIKQQENKGYSGSLIRKYTFDEADFDGKIRYKIWLEPELVSQFQEDTYTHLRHEQRQRLGRSSLAKWLHSYYSTHSQPYGLKTATLHSLCASDTKVLSRFRFQCKEAHEKLVGVGFLKSWNYDNHSDIFLVERNRETTSKLLPLPTNQ